MARYNYFDKVHFGNCLKEAIYKKYPSVGTFAFYNFKDKTSRAISNWVTGEAMPDADSMRRLAIIFGRDEVISWLKFVF